MSKQSSTGQKVARATSAAVNIARGAAAGGVYGAAFEAAKSFLPELLKLFIILLFIVILVPMLIFTAIPNILFGYGSSSDQDIIDFTASAEELGSRYQQLDAYHEPVLQRLVNNILPNFWSVGRKGRLQKGIRFPATAFPFQSTGSWEGRDSAVRIRFARN